MPTKTTGSHTASALVALFASSVLSKYVHAVTPSLTEASTTALRVVDAIPAVAVPTDTRAAGAVFVIVAVTVAWEVAHWIRTR
ncbi:hypothetical protein RYH80_10660 [Halobaculum sp. MBLA0147]|uniref:hypothetical protein n=1 Tax=Halobaculum sp. MBLA0147 TaxID=3079934 RepID=UPI003524D9BB